MVKAFRAFGRISGVAATLALAACTVHKAEVPPLSGPSELALAMRVTAIPDSISQDGASQSSIEVSTFGPDGNPRAGVPVRLDILVGGVVQDFGQLSARTIVTGSDGKVRTVYTAPPPPPSTQGGSGTLITILATPTGSNFQTSQTQSVDIRLVPPGVILPPADTPTPFFTLTPTPVAAKLPVTFDASASCPGRTDSSGNCLPSSSSTITSYIWNFGDGTPQASGRVVSHTFALSATYNVTLTVTNDRGVSASRTLGVAVTVGALPNADFTFSPSAPVVQQSIVFDASLSTPGQGHTIASYRWVFDDGSTGAGVSVSHAYAAAGDYIVQLTVTDEAGQSATVQKDLTVAANPPRPNFTFAPSAPGVQQMVVFDASSSTPGQGHTIVSYRWTFDDGTTGTGITVAHAFAVAGDYNVQLTVTDETGQLASIQRTVRVTSTTPRAAFTFSPTSPSVRQTVFFDGSTSTPGTGHTIASYQWTFGDGSTASGVTTSHAFATAGAFTVRLTVTDETGQFGTVTTTVTVASSPQPSADFVFSPAAPQVNQTIVFDASGSRPGTGRTIASYGWNFGDGASKTGVNVVHDYGAAGTYTVTLTVTDDIGQQATSAKAVTVVAGTSAIVADFTFSPTDPKISTNTNEVFFDGTPSNSPSGITAYEWDFGDGKLELTRFEAKPRHLFDRAATYVVRLTVTDGAGRKATTTKSVTVAP